MKNLEPRKVAEEKRGKGEKGNEADANGISSAPFPPSPSAVTLADCRLPTAVLRLQASFGLVLLLAAVTPVQAATSKATSNAPDGAKTNAPAAAPVAPAETPVPKSQFGSLLVSGKDPFYPDSVRRQQKISVTETNPAVVVAPEVRINGFSGNAARPLVIINNVTFGEGDEQMVTTAAGRARVRCLKIRTEDQAVEIEINGQRREIKFLDRK